MQKQGWESFRIRSAPPEILTCPGNAIQKISCGTHCLAVTQNGSVFGWGSNYYGQLGLGYTGNPNGGGKWQFNSPTLLKLQWNGMDLAFSDVWADGESSTLLSNGYVYVIGQGMVR